MSKTVQCADCGIDFCLPDQLHRARLNDHANFYCPHGHSNYYPGKSEEAKLRDQIAVLRSEIDYLRGSRDSWKEAAESWERRAYGYKGAMRKAQREAGIIPIANAGAA